VTVSGETFVHPLALVEKGAELGAGVRIGPFCHVGPEAVLGDGVELVGHVSVFGATTIGSGTKVWPQTVLGGPPQTARHKGGRTTLVIGANCLIREAVTMNVGSDSSRGETSVGANGQFFAYAHIAHDCVVGEGAIFANGVTLGGHVEIGRNVYIGGLTAVHQFVRIGDRAFVGGCSAVVGDVVPFGIAAGNRAKLRGPNAVGLKRSGMSRSELFALRDAYKMIFDPARPIPENIELTRSAFPEVSSVAAVLDFLTSRGKRHLTTPPLGGSDDGDDDGEAV
jgi:UDP-N-acetylglucosamine acyltransferase